MLSRRLGKMLHKVLTQRGPCVYPGIQWLSPTRTPMYTLGRTHYQISDLTMAPCFATCPMQEL